MDPDATTIPAAPADDGCLSAETLFFYSEGLLEPDETRAVAAHLRSCATCCARYRQEAELTVSLRSLPAPFPAAGFAGGVVERIRKEGVARATPRWWWLVAAVLALTPAVAWLALTPAGVAGAPGVLGDVLLSALHAPVAILAWLGSGDAWFALGATAEAIAGAVTSSPASLATFIAAIGVVAAFTNCVLWRAARIVLASQR